MANEESFTPQGVNQAVEDLRLGQYINAAMQHIEEATTEVLQYCTKVCPECEDRRAALTAYGTKTMCW